jgi:hypothetical protein
MQYGAQGDLIRQLETRDEKLYTVDKGAIWARRE